MGLDMYLKGKRYIWDKESEENKALQELSSTFGKGKRIKSIELELGYWRKANAIHQWFVDNVQEGKDDCDKYFVSFNDLVKLKDVCRSVLDNGKEFALTHLPPASGFFFGTAEVDEYYWHYVRETYELCLDLCSDPDIQSGTIDMYYQSSW
jgi:hypothetical protein